MKPRWHYQDIIDLEYFLHIDRTIQDTELQLRDRDIFLKLEDPDQQASDDRILLQSWIRARRQAAEAQDQLSSPGLFFRRFLGFTRLLSPIKGLLAGVISGFAFFSYNGSTPINVFHFLLLFVVSQLLLTMFFLGSVLFRFLRGTTAQGGSITLLGKSLAASTNFFFRRHLRGLLTGTQRTSLEHVLGKLKAGSGLYGHLFSLPFLILIQLFGVAFNCGLLGITLIRVATSDLAFGWQSTLRFSDQFLARLVEQIALPWAWLPGGFPSLSQIAGSRIILKDSIVQLTTADLTAWWPFLVMSLICYGLLPRLTLLAWMVWKEKKGLANLQLASAACQQLLRRMRTPRVSTQAEAQQTKTLAKDLPADSRLTQTSKELFATVLIPDDVFELCNTVWLATTLREHHFRLSEQFRFLIDYEEDLRMVTRLGEKQWQPEETILLIMEGWMVPLEDFLSLLRKLRQKLPRQTLSIGLLGKPEASGFSYLKNDDLNIWRTKIGGLGDPYIDLFPLGETV